MQDSIIRYMAAKGNVRILLAQTTEACEQARLVHNASPVATAAIGRVLTATALLASDIKVAEGSITTNVVGNGPLGRVTAVARPDGQVKAMALQPMVDLPLRADGKLDVSGAVGREGRLAVIRDIGAGEPWVGQVNLVSGEIAEDFTMYLAVSEQQPSVVSLGVLVNSEGSVLSAGGIIVQPMPGCPESTLTALEDKVSLLGDISRRLLREGAEGLIASVFADMNPERIGEMPVQLQCDCSRERLSRALVTLGKDELTEMIEQDSGAELHCQFCNTHYQFDAEALASLLAEAHG